MKKLLFVLAVLAVLAAPLGAGNPTVVEIALWPSGAPSSNGLESVGESAGSGRVSNVSDPVLYVFPASEPNGKMVIACPGGAYALLSMDHEGRDMAQWMNAQGVTYAVLKYRMPNGHSEVPLDDARRAIAIARERSGEWGVDADKIGVMGFSAGGHLAASLATLHGGDARWRPDFQILLYPVISMGEFTHWGSRRNLLGENATDQECEYFSLSNRVDAMTPKAFIALSSDDAGVSPMNSLMYAEALIANKVPVSLHVYPSGGHGWGYADSFDYKRQWTAELEKFLSEI